jgi:hypothetical protein
MDPFLENAWGDVHASLTTYTRNQLQPQLPPDLRSRIEEHVPIEADGEEIARYRPDARVVERPDVAGARALAGAAVSLAEPETAEPILIPIEVEAPTDRSITVIDRAGGRVVTSIEFLTPHNKLTERERQKFRRKQELLLAGGVNLVEIDLVRQGGWALSVREPARPQSWSYPYRVCVVRAIRPSFAECYVMPLRERLPAIRIPLRPDDADVRLDLQPLIDAAWRDGRYDAVDYVRQPMPPFDPADIEWINGRLAGFTKERSHGS